jgi:outer membrane receptor protein involved in Fe transport
VDTAGFWNRYDKLSAHVMNGLPAPFRPGYFGTLIVPLMPVNGIAGATAGVEIAAEVEITRNWRIKPVYSGIHNALSPMAGMQVVLGTNNLEPAPAQQFQLRSYWQPARRIQFDTIFWVTSKVPGSNYPAFARIDARAGVSLTELTELSFGLQNGLDGQYPEYVSLDHRPPAVLRRSAWIRLTWRF